MRFSALSLPLVFAALASLACDSSSDRGEQAKADKAKDPPVTKTQDEPPAPPVPKVDRAKQTALKVAELPGVKPEAWEAATPEERLATLDAIEAIAAEVDLRPKATVKPFAYEVPADVGMIYYGGYRIEANELLIDPGLLEDPAQHSQALMTTLHCGRYAFQVAAVKEPERYPDIDAETRAGWSAPYQFPPIEGIEAEFDRVYMRPPDHKP